MTEQFKFTPAEIEQINKLDHYSGTETNDRLFPLIEQVLAPRWGAAAREAERMRELERLCRELYAAHILTRAYAISEMRQQDIDALEALLEKTQAALKGREQ